jgi:hypothetical protein
MLSFPVVGTLIASRSPRNSIAWIMIWLGLSGAIASILGAYAEYGLVVKPGSLPSANFAVALSQPMWVPFIGLSGTFLILLFPDGRLPSPRWRAWAWISASSLVISFMFILTLPGSFADSTFADSGFPNVQNPLGVEALGHLGGAAYSVLILIPISIVGCAAGLVTRFRRSHGRERLQLRWLATAGSVVAVSYLLLMLLSAVFGFVGDEPEWVRSVQAIGIAPFILIPISIGVAILRHRLYDIDLIINRTLVYGALTAALFLAYLGAISISQALVKPVAGGSDLSVAASTLAVAALFRPVKIAIQGFIDRRFYRRKYDAQRTLESFSARARDRVDLEGLGDELLSLVSDAMQPAHVSLWLKGSTPMGPAPLV